MDETFLCPCGKPAIVRLVFGLHYYVHEEMGDSCDGLNEYANTAEWMAVQSVVTAGFEDSLPVRVAVKGSGAARAAFYDAFEHLHGEPLAALLRSYIAILLGINSIDYLVELIEQFGVMVVTNIEIATGRRYSYMAQSVRQDASGSPRHMENLSHGVVRNTASKLRDKEQVRERNVRAAVAGLQTKLNRS